MCSNAICYILVNLISMAATTSVELRSLQNDSTNELGVIVDNLLKFQNHTNFVVTKAEIIH